jgi:hypothetical protein
MSSTFDATADEMAVLPAQLVLDQLMAWVGVDGLVAALRSPGLLAAVDQHAAAVRAALRAGKGAVDADGLAGYARSVVAAAHRMGRPVPGSAVDGVELDWSRAGWHIVRLVAICHLADEVGCL